jgi:hypothetical protein
MIRHTKDQRIGGAAALALPKSDSCTIWLDMSKEERTLYKDAAVKSAARLKDVKTSVVARSTLETKLSPAREACGQVYISANYFPDSKLHFQMKSAVEALYKKTKTRARDPINLCKGLETVWEPIPSKFTKVRALLEDLAELKKQEPSMHCVVLTNSNQSHDMLVEVLRPLYAVCSLRAGTDCKQRDLAIRTFQEGLNGGPATVFVATMKV